MLALLEEASLTYLFIPTLAALIFVLICAVIGGRLARLIKLPTITGFLITGMLTGPFFWGLLTRQELMSLQLLEHSALGFIALMAGSELEIKTLKSRLGSILGVMLGLVSVTASIGTGALYLLADWLPFLNGTSSATRWAAAILAGVIMTARSPSAAIAVIGEMKAQGPFTQLILGVTVLMDAVVIILFAVAITAAQSLVNERPLSLMFLAEIGLELAASMGLGVLFGLLIMRLFNTKLVLFRMQWLLLCPIGVMWLSEQLHHLSLGGLPIHIEPLLTCLVIGVTFNLASEEVHPHLEQGLKGSAPAVYLIFFTLTGASLALDQLWLIWPAALAVFLIRLIGIGGGATLGGALVGEPAHQHRIRWMGFVTQAGVGLGLSARVAEDFPTWGLGFATMMTAVIVMNECLGPIFFKRALILSGEGQSSTSDPLEEAELRGLEGTH